MVAEKKVLAVREYWGMNFASEIDYAPLMGQWVIAENGEPVGEVSNVQKNIIDAFIAGMDAGAS